MNNKRSFFLAVFLCASAPVFAGPFTDDMSKCLVRATTEQDKTTLVQWVFAVMAVHPSVKEVATVGDTKRAELNKKIGELLIVLLTDRCGKESREAVKNEGLGAIETSFGVLGQVATQQLFSDPSVTGAFAELAKYVDEDKMKSLVEGVK